MHVHLVFVTKYRREVFTKAILDDLRAIFASVCADFEAELVEFDGEDDHVHLLVNYPPKMAVSNLVIHPARANGRGAARRSAGAAIGKNNIALLIPCHHVIRETGEIGSYRWGSDRKAALLAREAAQAAR